MKTTTYELLGMIKDGKAPKKIKDRLNMIYTFSASDNDYVGDEAGKLFFYNLMHFRDKCLNDEVEILEEPKGIPEKLKIEQDTPSSNYYIKNEFGTKCALTKHSKIIADKVNELLDYLESKGDE